MSAYRRLIAYFSYYERGVKRNSSGFVKMETRGKCNRLFIRANVNGMNGKELKLYAIMPFREVNGLLRLREITVYRGIAEATYEFCEDNRLKSIQGVLLFISGESYYAASWVEDVVSGPFAFIDESEEAEFDLQEESRTEEQQNSDTYGISGQEPEQRQTEERQNSDTYGMQEKEQEESRTEERQNGYTYGMSEQDQEVRQTEENEDAGSFVTVSDEADRIIQTVSVGGKEVRDTIFAEPNGTQTNMNVQQEDSEEKQENGEENQEDSEEKQELSHEDKHYTEIDIYDKKDNSSTEDVGIKRIFSLCKRHYPFEDYEISDCIKIEPRDIGLLPMELWSYANNSFLLHAYYNYGHLLFAKRGVGKNAEYLLMVPGVNCKREKMISKKYGFEGYKGTKRTDREHGSFGYWYHMCHKS